MSSMQSLQADWFAVVPSKNASTSNTRDASFLETTTTHGQRWISNSVPAASGQIILSLISQVNLFAGQGLWTASFRTRILSTAPNLKTWCNLYYITKDYKISIRIRSQARMSVRNLNTLCASLAVLTNAGIIRAYHSLWRSD